MSHLFRTPPLAIVDMPADQNHYSTDRQGYRWIVIHSTAGKNSEKWLSRTSVPPVSCHRLIDKTGRIYKILPDDLVAFTQGPARVGPLPRRNDKLDIYENLNQWSLSIELENLNDGQDPYPPRQVESCAWQCVEWIGLYGFLPIVAHEWIQSSKSDPRGFKWQQFYAEMWELMAQIARGVA